MHLSVFAEAERWYLPGEKGPIQTRTRKNGSGWLLLAGGGVVRLEREVGNVDFKGCRVGENSEERGKKVAGLAVVTGVFELRA